jgi:hypothetical protein
MVSAARYESTTTDDDRPSFLTRRARALVSRPVIA